MQMRGIYLAWLLLAATATIEIFAADTQSSPTTTPPSKPGDTDAKLPENLEMMGTRGGGRALSHSEEPARFNFLLMALDWMKNKVRLSDPAMKSSWTKFSEILNYDNIMRNPQWEQQLIFLVAQNAQLSDFVFNLNNMLHIYPTLYTEFAEMLKTHNLPGQTVEQFRQWLQHCTSMLAYLGYRPGHGIQHPYQPGIQGHMYQMPNNYGMSPEIFHNKYGQVPLFNGGQQTPQAVVQNSFNVNGCPHVNITFNLQINGKTHCWTSVTSPTQSLKNFLVLAAYQNRCFSFDTLHRPSRIPMYYGPGLSREGDYIKSINGIGETSTMMWQAFMVNGPKDLELSSFEPRHNAVIIINYADSNIIKANLMSNH